MRCGLVVAAEPRQQLTERDLRAPRVLEREARLEIRLRLAPELRALAQHAERVQQHRVLAVLGEPALRLLELTRRVGGPALGVERGEVRVPMPLEATREDVGSLAIRAD